MKYIIVGAGLFGCVIAERIANVLRCPVEIIEKRQHFGGNCHSFIDRQTGIECHQFGTHVFHTKLPNVWEYINKFTEFNSYRHRVFTRHAGKVYSLPINLDTINSIYGCAYDPDGAKELIRKEAGTHVFKNPENLEDMAISLVGGKLYDALIRNYTRKQWAREPETLPKEIITRLPVRYFYNGDYFNDPWQGIPSNGYGAMFGALLANPFISLRLGEEFALPANGLPTDTTVIYTGEPDRLFSYKLGRLEWRCLRFEWQTLPKQDFQGCGQMNYADIPPEFTRIHEYKHYHPEWENVFNAPETVICREFPADHSENAEPCYPVNNARNELLYRQYRREADAMPGLILGGRLGSYKYWNMDITIAEALALFNDRILR